MSMLKRRQLGNKGGGDGTNSNNQGQTNQPSGQQGQQNRPQGQGQQQGNRNNNQNRNPNQQAGGRPQGQGQNNRPQGQGQQQGNRNNNQNRNPNQQAGGRPQGNQQGGRPQQGQGQNRNQQGNRNNNQNRNGNQNRHRQRQPPKPAAYLQRDVLLLAMGADTEKVNEVRTKFDPLVKKLPVHITLVLPEPALTINDQFLEVTEADVKSLGELTFTEIIAYDDRYLWLLPDAASSEKIKAFRNHYVSKITNHTQGEEFDPHLSLGYIPRKTMPEDAINFAKGLISLPLTLKFNKLLLEEFEENQISKTIKEVLL
jgi:DNA mismatch repair ATPase MutL